LNIDLEALSLKELRDLQAHVTKAISSFEDRRKKLALSELEEKAKELGFSLSELTGAVKTFACRCKIRKSCGCSRNLVWPWAQATLVCRSAFCRNNTRTAIDLITHYPPIGGNADH
jgi:hypothetical protein